MQVVYSDVIVYRTLLVNLVLWNIQEHLLVYFSTEKLLEITKKIFRCRGKQILMACSFCVCSLINLKNVLVVFN